MMGHLRIISTPLPYLDAMNLDIAKCRCVEQRVHIRAVPWFYPFKTFCCTNCQFALVYNEHWMCEKKCQRENEHEDMLHSPLYLK